MTDPAPGRERAWLTRLAQLLGSSAVPSDRPVEADTHYGEVEDFILGGPRRYTKAQLVGESSIDTDFADRLWRSLGFAEVADDEVVFTDGDREAVAALEKLREAGLVPGEVEEAMSRAVGQAMAGLADWQIEMLYQIVDYGHSPVGDDEIVELGERIIPMLEQVQVYVWRRHLAAAAGRLVTAHPSQDETRTLAVGFADLVGFSRATRRSSPADLTQLIEGFQRITNDVVAEHRGRVVKTVGDEVLFVADHADDGALIALDLLEQLAANESLPQLRIGLALGDVVTRFGDVFGEAVNIASRLTTHARPGRILVDRNLAAALEADRQFQLRVRRPLTVRGYRHLHTWGLTRSRARPPSTPGET
ncbi:MAG TPA: adenylate/guanylate cyclase domain-containing protein [Pseudonocardia sp.]